MAFANEENILMLFAISLWARFYSMIDKAFTLTHYTLNINILRTEQNGPQYFVDNIFVFLLLF